MAATFQHVQQEPNGMTTHTNNTFVNVNVPERVLSVLAGAFLIYKGFKKIKDKPTISVTEALAGGFLLFRGATGHCPAYAQTGLDTSKVENINIKSNFTVGKDRADVYAFWRRLENLPLFMRHIESVEQLDEKTSRWKIKVPGNMGNITLLSEIVEDKDYFIGWRSIKGSDIFTAGKVEFKDAPGGQGTEIQAVVSYKAPGGALGTQIGKLLNPVFENYVREDIRNFKQFIESGEIPTTEGQPSGRKSSITNFFSNAI